MFKIGIIFKTLLVLSGFLGGGAKAFANIPSADVINQQLKDLLSPPQVLRFTTLLCGHNTFTNSTYSLEVQRVCLLRANLDNGIETLEAFEITWSNGEVSVFHLSSFSFDVALSRKYNSQILKASIRGDHQTGYAISHVYKEYPSSSHLTREENPNRLLGTLPSGHNFIVNRR